MLVGSDQSGLCDGLPLVRLGFESGKGKLQIIMLLNNIQFISEESSINHVMYANGICSLAPTATAMQSLFGVCYEYGTDIDIVFNPIKSIGTVFKPMGYKLYLPNVFISQETLKNVSES